MLKDHEIFNVNIWYPPTPDIRLLKISVSVASLLFPNSIRWDLHHIVVSASTRWGSGYSDATVHVLINQQSPFLFLVVRRIRRRIPVSELNKSCLCFHGHEGHAGRSKAGEHVMQRGEGSLSGADHALPAALAPHVAPGVLQYITFI